MSVPGLDDIQTTMLAQEPEPDPDNPAPIENRYFKFAGKILPWVKGFLDTSWKL